MERYPTLDELLAGMQSRVGTTENWDVVVSYSVDKLNSLIRKVWKTNSKISSGFNLESQSEDIDGNPYSIEWQLLLGIPQLEFLLDGQAKLAMSLAGKYRPKELDRDGKERVWKEIVPNKFLFIAVVPLAWVSAHSGTEVTNKGKSSAIIGFDEDPSAELHVVFDFKTTNLGASYSIQPNPNYPNSTEGTKSVPDTFSVSLREKLAAWISDPTNMSSIQYALATVKSTEVPDQIYLTPELVSFSIFTNREKTGVGCLSLYIKTKDSGHAVGNSYRSFRLPASKNANTYPIPDGYTASIIIRHDLFLKKFLEEPILAAKTGDKKQFSSVVAVNDNQSGFKLDLAVNSAIAMDAIGKENWLATRIKEIKWDLGSSPLTLTIDTKGNISYLYYFKGSTKWEANTLQPVPSSFGVVELELSVDKNTTFISEATGKGVAARMTISENDWKRQISGVEPSFWGSRAGQLQTVPGEVRRALDKLPCPSWHHSAKLDYFAATNIFAPGKTCINVAGPRDVFLPYDVLICGNVEEGVLGLNMETTSPPNMSLLKQNGTNFNALQMASLASDSEAANDTERFVQDMILEKPVLRAALTALATGDEDTVNSFIKNSGYNISYETMGKIWASATGQVSFTSTNSITTTSSSGFDIRFVAGMYTFVAPSPSDLLVSKTNIITIVSSTARLYVDNVYVNNTTTDTGSVTFTSGAYNYEINFTSGFKNDGTIDATTFTGRRWSTTAPVPPATINYETVNGKQVVPTVEPPRWISTDAALWLGFISTVGGFILTMAIWVIHEPPKKPILQKVKEGLTDCYSRWRDPGPAPALHPEFSMKDYSKTIESAVKMELEGLLKELDMEGGKYAEVAPELASRAAKKVLEKRVRDWAEGDPLMELMKRIAPDAEYKLVLDMRMTKATAEYMKDFGPKSRYIQTQAEIQFAVHDQVKMQAKIQRATDLREEIVGLRADKVNLDRQLKALEANPLATPADLLTMTDQITHLEIALKLKTEHERDLSRDARKAEGRKEEAKAFEEVTRKELDKERERIFEK